jgi:peptidoglycan/LPS O-acetylase OafA/YrhL
MEQSLVNRKSMSVGQAFDAGPNGLAAIRLLLATTVILWHSFPLTGTTIEWRPLEQIVSSFRVDTFFAISGFLVLRSWERRPSVANYLRGRFFRILPAFWVNLAITALLIAPLATLVSGGSVAALFEGPNSALAYIGKNATTWILQFDIAGSPERVPYPNVWNGSMWMIPWEMIGYLGILVIGVLGVSKHPRAILSLTVIAWLAVLANSLGVLPGGWYGETGSRFGLMLLCGSTLYLYRNAIPFSGLYALGALALIAVGAFLPDYRLLGAPALAYLVFWAALKLRSAKFRPRNDLSFGIFLYGFPVQQALLLCGWSIMNPLLFGLVAVVCTLPFAAASWFLVEKPAAAMKRKFDRRKTDPRDVEAMPVVAP